MASMTLAAVDLGAESGRVVAGHFDGSKLTLEEIHRFPNQPTQVLGTLHWDVLRLWHEIQDGLTKLARSTADVRSVGVDTWGVDFGLLDERGRLLGNPIHYRDKRHDGWMERAIETAGRDAIFGATGLQFMPFNTLFQLLALQDQEPQVLGAARRLAFMPDLLHFWLSGQRACEYTIASTSQMLDARERSWSADLISRFNLPTQVLGDIVHPGTAIGKLHSSVLKATGLSADVQVVLPGSHDTASAVVAVPAEGEDWAYLSSGTWSLMGLELAEPLIDEHVQSLNFTNEGGVAHTIRFLKNIAGLWLVQGCRRSFARQGREYSYGELASLAQQAAPLQVLVEPDDPSFSAPDDMAQAIREYAARTNQPAPQTDGALIRCCLESLALKYRWTFERLEELRGKPLQVLHIVGGGVQNQALCQWTADCLGRPVVAGPVEATAAGNVLAQAMGASEIADLEQARGIVRASFEVKRYEPDANAKARWDEAFGRFERFAR
jgi:rhamnulokinase